MGGGGKVGEEEDSNNEDGEGGWSLKKYDFDAPDVKETVKDHKPNFVKAPRRVFEKHDGYYSEEDEEANAMDNIEGKEKAEIKCESEREELGEEKEVPQASGKDASAASSEEKADCNDGFKRATREEFNMMSRKEKKKYLKKRR